MMAIVPLHGYQNTFLECLLEPYGHFHGLSSVPGCYKRTQMRSPYHNPLLRLLLTSGKSKMK
jgi:hypothetical protein